MFSNFHRILLPVFLFLLTAFSLRAQEAQPQRNREFLIGTTLGAGFNPRLMYKKVNEKSVTRYLFRLNSGTSSDRNSFQGDLDEGIARRIFNLDLALGMGLEWRSELMRKLQVYYGGDVEAIYGYSSSHQSRPRIGVTPGSSSEEGHQMQEHSSGLRIGMFAGFRYAVSERISFAVEAGPDLSGRMRFSETESRIVANQGSPDEELVVRQESRRQITANFRIVSPVYLQFAIHF